MLFSDTVWTLDGLVPPIDNPSIALSHSNIALIMLVDLILEREMDVTACLPKLLHVVFLHLDNPWGILYGHARQLLANIIYRLNDKRKTEGNNYDELQEFVDTQMSTRLWTDYMPQKDSKIAFEKIAWLVHKLLDAIKNVNLVSNWCTEGMLLTMIG